MSAESDYLRAERENILQTVSLIEDLLAKLEDKRLVEIAQSLIDVCRSFLLRMA